MWLSVDPSFDGSRGFITSLISFSPAEAMPFVATWHFMLVAVFLLWLPLTHMTHFVGKYFTYHKVRWEDHPNIRGSALESAVIEALDYRIKWSAPHIKTGGTWAEAATDKVSQQEREDE
jgi:hypothetical protein